MSWTLSSFEQQYCGVSYFDCSTDKQFVVRDVLTPLLRQPVDVAQLQQQNIHAAKIIRVVIDVQLLQAPLDDVITALLVLKTETVHIVCELLLSPEQLHSSANSKSQCNQLLHLAQLSNLLICSTELFTLITGTAGLTEHRQQKNSQLLSDLSLQAVILSSNHVNSHWLYCTASTWGQLSFDNRQSSKFRLSTSDTVADLSQFGFLSAAISAFMLQGKRCCDALVLSLAYLQQNADRLVTDHLLESQPITLAGGWPCDLSYYPNLDTGLTRHKPTIFASTDTLSLGLYPVVDSISWLEKLLKLGVKTIQLRIKNTAEEQLENQVATAAQLGRQYQARLFINDYWRLAIKYQCYGVHLGQEDLDNTDLSTIAAAGLRLGVSTHSEYEWLRAVAIKPSYIAMGTVYPTQTKPAILIGLSNLQRWCKTLANHYPLVAIGGIKLDNIEPVLASGVGSIAVVTAITLAEDYRLATEQLTQLQLPQRRV